MKPRAWSYTSLSDFTNCPRAYYEKRIAKSVEDDPNSPHLVEGRRVHEAFEHRVGKGTPLPDDLAGHEAYMESLATKPGIIKVERKIAINLKGEVCGFFDKAPPVWFRGVIDYSHIDGELAEIEDYKTGKPHSKFGQLKLFALHVFSEFPKVQRVRARYYWTQTKTTTGEHYTRDNIPYLWRQFVPDLKQYKQAYNEDVWQPRPSGLCNGWCPVTSCEHWKPKRKK